MADIPFVVADLPAGLLEPGVYVQVRTDSDAGLSAPNNRCLIWGYMSSGGTGIPNQPYRALSQSDVDARFRSYSMIAHAYAAAKSQIPIGMECWLMPLLEPSGGTAQVVKAEITGEPSAGVLSSATAAAAADTVFVRYRGRGVKVGIKAGDDWATIATNIKTAWDALDNAPATCSRSGAELSFTARHKGAFDDAAFEISFASEGASGVAAILGTVTFSGVAAVASSGSYTLTIQNKTVQATIADTSTAAQSATALVNKFLTSSWPIRAAQAGTPDGVVKLFYVNGRPIRPLSISGSLSGVTTQTAALARGTAGAGVPTLTDALSNLGASEDAYRAWSLFYTSTTELSETATHIEVEEGVAEGMKGQCAIFCLTSSLSAISSANLPEATTPKLSSSARYVPMWAQSAPNAAWELSARYAAAVAAEPYVARNWNGLVLKGSDSAPLVPIHPADRPTRDERNQAIGLRHAPVTVNGDGEMTVVWGGTCYKARGFKDRKLTKLSARLTLDYYRTDLAQYLAGLYGGKKIKTASAPRTSNATDTKSVEAAVYRWTKRLDDNDLFDGAEAKRDAIRAAVVVSPTRIDVNVDFAPPADLDIVAVTGISE